MQLQKRMADLRPKLVARARNKLRNPDDAEDVVQAVLLAAWRNREGIRPQEASTYLWSALHNRVANVYRTEERSRMEPWPTYDDGGRRPLTDDVMDRPVERVHARRLLASVPQPDRELLRRCVMHGESTYKVSAEHGKSETWANTRIARRLERMRQNGEAQSD